MSVARAVGSGLVLPLSVGSAVTVLVALTRPVELVMTIVVAVLGALVFGWLCLFSG